MLFPPWVAPLTALLATSLASPLPKAFRPCKVDKNLSSCAVRVGNEGWPILVKGDPKYRIPPLDPFQVTELRTQSGEGTNIRLEILVNNVQMSGLKDMKIKAIRFDFKKKHMEYDLFMPKYQIKGDYKMDGKFLLFPVQGSGKANVTMVNTSFTAKLDYALERNKNNVEMMKIVRVDMSSYNLTRMYSNFENLFNGNKQLSENMNEVLNENWQDLVKELGPSFTEALGEIFKAVVGSVLAYVPFKEIFVF